MAACRVRIVFSECCSFVTSTWPLRSTPPVISPFPTSAFSSLSKAPCSEAELRPHSCPQSSLPPIPLAPRDPKRWSWSWWRSRTVFSSPPPPSLHRPARLTRLERSEKPGPRKSTSCCRSSASQWTSPTSGGSRTCATRMEEVRGENLFYGQLWSFFKNITKVSQRKLLLSRSSLDACRNASKMTCKISSKLTGTILCTNLIRIWPALRYSQQT